MWQLQFGQFRLLYSVEFLALLRYLTSVSTIKRLSREIVTR